MAGTPNLFVIARFLRRLQEHPDGVPRARFQEMVRVNYDIFRRYTDLLVDRAHILVADVEGTVTFTVTDDGIRALERLQHALDDWLGGPGP